ncbi:hypothetical protein LINPERHAP2_LOCUS28684 [Linum perenne]
MSSSWEPRPKREKNVVVDTTYQVAHIPASIQAVCFRFTDMNDLAKWHVIKEKGIRGSSQIDWASFEEEGWVEKLREHLEKAGLTPFFEVAELGRSSTRAHPVRSQSWIPECP